ncbi:MAG: hypothetical protein RL318_223 [Fibrobacterota bacterium]|jgi:sulfite reductase (NADPH) flavoprotein alpha-component
MNAPLLPESAPFTTEQRGWLNGYLAGLLHHGNLEAARGGSVGASTPKPSVPTRTLRVLYASQSGNAETAAHALGERLRGADAGEGHVWAVAVDSMDSFASLDWSAETHLALVSSTWGDGELPDNGKTFGAFLDSEAAASLSGLRFAVLGLGDRNYARFCAAAVRLDARLEAVGAKRFLPLETLDTDWEAGAKAWREALASGLGAGGGTPATDSVNAGVPPKEEAKAGWSRTNPFPAPLLENRRLNAPGSGKDTRHIALSLAGSGLAYRAGDALGVWPINPYELVDSLVIACDATGSELVRLPDGTESTFRAALLSRFDLNRPGKDLLGALREHARGQGDRRRLQALLSPEGEAERAELMAASDVLDLLRAFPTAVLQPQELLSHLRKLMPRLYSISSSPLAHPGEVHLTVGVHRTEVGGRLRLGVASTFLSDRLPLGLAAGVFVQPSGHFHPPEDPSRDLIMVGPGTGIAPFRAFLHEREASGATGRNWLFFGDRHVSSDFLYREEIEGMRARGTLHQLDLAFSRDGAEKLYVQDLMRRRAKELWAWLEGGACFCVCGDAKRMAKDVDAALQEVVVLGGGKSSEEAKAYVDSMRKEHRYLRDVY